MAATKRKRPAESPSTSFRARAFTSIRDTANSVLPYSSHIAGAIKGQSRGNQGAGTMVRIYSAPRLVALGPCLAGRFAQSDQLHKPSCPHQSRSGSSVHPTARDRIIIRLASSASGAEFAVSPSTRVRDHVAPTRARTRPRCRRSFRPGRRRCRPRKPDAAVHPRTRRSRPNDRRHGNT